VRRQVLARLSNGWSRQQIALHLGISLKAVKHQIYKLCHEERVPNEQALGQKLNFAKLPPPRRSQLCEARRPLVQQMLLANCGYKEMAQKLGVTRNNIMGDVNAINRAHGIKAKGIGAARRALAEKLGVSYISRADELGAKAAALREKGLTWEEVGRELKISEALARYHVRKLASQKEQQVPRASKQITVPGTFI
jgi:biotin operon repressor